MTAQILGRAKKTEARPIPIYGAVECGDPFPGAQIKDVIDLSEHCIGNHNATFYVRASGDSMIEAGIHDGDVLVVDRSIEPEDGSIVIAAVGGDLTVKRLSLGEEGVWWLLPENETYEPIPIDVETHLWGVVTFLIHKAE